MRDNKNIVIIAILVVCIVIMMLTIVASASFELGLSAKSAALYEPITGTFIYEKQADVRLPMASTTKIMTALIAIEECQLDELVEIPGEAVGIEGSSVYLTEGDTVTVKDLIYSLLLQSANDAATALALKISGDVASFAELMNKKAEQLGMTNTHFDNPHGLDSQTHYTTARDLAVLASAALKNTTLKSISSTYKYSFTISGKPRTVVNHNKMLKLYDGAIGLKTGFTRKSGRCLVSAAERDGVTLIAVTLDAPDDWRDHTALLDLGFDSYEAVSIDSLLDSEYQVAVMDSGKQQIIAKLQAEGISLVKSKDEEGFTVHLDIPSYVVAPIAAGDKIGEVVIERDGIEIARIDIVAAEAATSNKKTSIFDIFKPREK